MNINIDTFEDNISKAFCNIMLDSVCSQKGMRRYRIYLFTYIFGCISEYDMPYLFPEDNIYNDKSGKELLNMHRSSLNFFSRNGDLEKLDDGFFLLKKPGLCDLYDYLLNNHFIEKIEFAEFNRKYRPIKGFLSHSSKAGRVVLSFIRLYSLNFIREPIIDSKGMIDGSLPGTAYNNFIVPDAILFSMDDNERIFIEADSSQERINSKIIPKFNNYISFVFSEDSLDSPSTIHFSIWNSEEKEIKFNNCSYDLGRIISFFNFITNNLLLSISFKDYIALLCSYKDTCMPVCELSNLLKKYEISDVSSMDELRKKLEYYYNRDYYSKDYITRSNSIFSCSKKVKQLNGLLLKGTRLVCTPFNSYDVMYKYIYLENYIESLKNYLNSILSSNYTFLEFKKIHRFTDEKTGFYIYFRNVFIYKNNDDFKYISFENISDDISGLIRSKYYAYSYQIPSIGDFSLYCIYNEFIENEPSKLFEQSKRLHSTINFISYEDLSSIL